MLNIIRMELYRLRRLASFKALLLIGAVLDILFSLTIYDNSNGLKGFMNAFWDSPLMIIFCAILAGLYLGSDFTNKTINLQISTGHSRIKILIGKTLVYFIATVPMILIYPIICTAVQTFRYGWGEPFTTDTVMYILRVVSLSILLNFGSCSFFVLFTFIFQDMAKSISVSIVFYLLASILLNLVGNAFPFITQVYNNTTFVLSRQVINQVMTNKEVITAVLSAIISMFAILSATYTVFMKRELK